MTAKRKVELLRTVLITGANRGIGLSLCKRFMNANWNVIGTARNPEQAVELKELGIHVYQLDIASEDSIAKFAKEIEKESNINLLINNAGVYQRAQGTNYKADDIRKEFNVNALGPLLLSTALLPKLKLSTFDGHHEAAIVCMTSRMGSIADNGSGGSYGYRASKAALNAFFKSWSIDHKDVPCVLVHPGYIQTDMTSQRGDMNASDCAEKLFHLFEKFYFSYNGKTKTNEIESGSFLHRDGQILPW